MLFLVGIALLEKDNLCIYIYTYICKKFMTKPPKNKGASQGELPPGSPPNGSLRAQWRWTRLVRKAKSFASSSGRLGPRATNLCFLC